MATILTASGRKEKKLKMKLLIAQAQLADIEIAKHKNELIAINDVLDIVRDVITLLRRKTSTVLIKSPHINTEKIIDDIYSDFKYDPRVGK